ncbi:MAG: HEPN domain-containing protein [archaeon]
MRSYSDRANNEIMAAQSLKILSEQAKPKQDFNIPKETTFYSAVISHSYYAIFYAAKAILLTKGIKTSSPEVHKKTYEALEKHFVKTGILDVKLLELYRKIAIRADELLEIFKQEKWKRGHFTYRTIPQANKKPAEDSIENAKSFVSNILKVIGKT